MGHECPLLFESSALNRAQPSLHVLFYFSERTAGFEPATSDLASRCSTSLNYVRLVRRAGRTRTCD